MRRVSVAQRVRDSLMRPLFGPDVFISYSRANRPYVEKLAARLHAKDERLTIVTDRKTSKPAEEIHPDLRALVRTSSMLVVVLTDDSIASNPVREEIETFLAYDRPLVAIDVEKAFDRCTWDADLKRDIRSPGLQPETRDALGDVKARRPADPSPDVVDAIHEAIDFRRQTSRIRLLATGALLLLIGVAAASSYMILKANRELAKAADYLNAAMMDAANARMGAQQARDEAVRQTAVAEERKSEAALAQLDAEFAGAVAARQQQIALAHRMANDSSNVLRQSPYFAETAALLGVEAMERLERVGQRSVVADIALREALAILPDERTIPLPRRALALGLSRDGRFVASAGKPGFLLCSSEKHRCSSIPFEEHGLGPPEDVGFSGNGAVVAAVHGTTERGCVHVHATGDHTPLRAPIVLERKPFGMALSRHGKSIAFVMEDRVAVHTTGTDSFRRKIALADVKSMEWSPADDDHLLLAAGKTVVWNVTENTTTELPTRQAGKAAFSPDGAQVATIQTEPFKTTEPLQVWQWRTRERRSPGCATPPFGSVAFSPDGRKIAVAQWRGSGHVYDLVTGEDVPLPVEIGALAFSADGSRIATSENHRTSRLWTVTTPPRELARSMSSFAYPLIAVRRDGAVVTASQADAIRVWHAHEWLDRRTPIRQRAEILTAARDPRDGSLAVAFREIGVLPAPDLARVGADGSVHECQGLRGRNALAFRADGALLTAHDGGVQWWEGWCSGAPRKIGDVLFKDPAAPSILEIATNRDGSVIAIARQREVNVFRNGRALGRVTRPHVVRSLALDPAGRFLAVANFPETPDPQIRNHPYAAAIWDLARALRDEPLREIGRPFAVAAVAFDPSGGSLAIAAGKVVHVMEHWASEVPRETARLVLDHRVTALAFSADGATLTAAGDRGTMLVAHWRPKEMIAIACGAVKTAWNEREWRAYNADVPSAVACAR